MLLLCRRRRSRRSRSRSKRTRRSAGNRRDTARPFSIDSGKGFQITNLEIIRLVWKNRLEEADCGDGVVNADFKSGGFENRL